MAKKKSTGVKQKKTKQTAKKATKSKKPASKKAGSSLQQLLGAIIHGIEEKKGNNIVALNLKNTGNSVADYFVICHANNKIQAEAIAESVQEQVFKINKETPASVEGKQNAEWILIDYFNVLVHVFTKEARDYYNIEYLWADAEYEKIAAHR